jgi:hypothetical protein
MFNFLYLDEAGSPSMTERGISDQRWLTLAGFYTPAENWRPMYDALRDLKTAWLSDYCAEPELVELHSTDFGRKSPWNDLYADGRWLDFLNATADLIRSLPITTMSATIDKAAHAAKYTAPTDPYELAYEFVIERFDRALRPDGCGAVILDPRAEGKGAVDVRMRVVHRELQRYRATIIEDPFFPASDLSVGLQIADVCAWGVRKHVQHEAKGLADTPIYAAVNERYRRSPSGRIGGYGEKLFP